MKTARILVLLVVALTTLWTSTGIEATRYQSCPPPTDDIAGICSEDCSVDEECSDQQICCSNGCGHTCVDPIPIPYHTHLLVCPSIDDDIAGICTESCANDSDCSTGELCCSNGCGHICKEGVLPELPCTAVYEHVTNQSLLGAYVPLCEDDGSFAHAQCHEGYCWCVEEDTGRPVSDMLRFTVPGCNCTYDDELHFVGETFPAGDGCNTCKCTMNGDVECSDLDLPCSGQQVFYSCPAVRQDSESNCIEECFGHNECLHSKKCCYNGCSYHCTKPVMIPYIPLPTTSDSISDCPDPSDVPCIDDGDRESDGDEATDSEDSDSTTRELRSCSGAGERENDEHSCSSENEVCCGNECSSFVCVKRSDSRPCYTARKIAGTANRNQTASLGSYSPQCDSKWQFRTMQCHEHYCWCVERLTGRPVSDMVPFEQSSSLQCSNCVYNGVKYHNLDTFPSADGCNQCHCFGGDIACTEMACIPDPQSADQLWNWWHSVLIACVVVVAVLMLIVAALAMGLCVLMRQNNSFRHKRLKEKVSSEPDVHYNKNHDNVDIELKVPVEEDDERRPANA